MNADLITEARAHVAAMADAAPPNSRARIIAGDVEGERTSLLVRLTNALEDEQRMRRMDTGHIGDLEAKIAAADAAFQQLHWSCDNPDHGGAYQALATALGYDVQEEHTDEQKSAVAFLARYGKGMVVDHVFIGVAGHPDDNECTHRADGTDATYCGRREDDHVWGER